MRARFLNSISRASLTAPGGRESERARESAADLLNSHSATQVPAVFILLTVAAALMLGSVIW